MNKPNYVCLQKIPSIIILCIYFIGYLIICPQLTLFMTKLLTPQATILHIPTMLSLNMIILFSIIFLARSLWKDSWTSFKKNYKEQFKRIIMMMGCILLFNMVLGLIITLLTGLKDSQNQEIIKSNLLIAPLYTFFGTCIFAPIVEEIVFRGAIFSSLRNKYSFLISAMVSSLIFGSIHLMSSIANMQWTDLVYIFLYGGMGYILAYNYEKSESIFVPIGIHFANNLFAFLMMLLK